MKNDGLYLNFLLNQAKNNISDITYDRCDERRGTIKSILHSHSVGFDEIPPGNDLYSYKFLIEAKGVKNIST